jgi:D-alanyl-lipoteichoic acid acyltransferase DltB (MBOAT superfamily)
MSVTSLEFLLFCAAVLGVYWLLPWRAQNALLVLASLVFYGCVHRWLVALILVAATATYLATNGMAWWPRWSRLCLVAGVAANLGLLAAFKYFGFFVEALAGGETSATVVAGLQVAMPVGLSFYTLQLTGYIVDVHRGDVDARRDPLSVALFACFFPLLLAGPIERAGHLFPQLEHGRRLSAEAAHAALALVVWGVFKKLVIADNVAVIADKVFALQDPGFVMLWAGVFAFAIQIYADFSAYSDIARGVSRWLGIEVAQNFRQPYASTSLADFWRRWHISLSSWLKDYVFFPVLMRMGATRLAAAAAVVVTFLFSGVWHGAGWTFIVWGMYHALLLIGERLAAHVPPLARLARVAAVRWMLTFGLVCLGWLIFRETDLAMLARHLTRTPWAETFETARAGLFFLALTLVYSVPLWLETAALSLRGPHPLTGRGAPWMGWAIRTAATTALLVGILAARAPVSFDFIYSRF